MKRRYTLVMLLSASLLCSSANLALGQYPTRESEAIQKSTSVLNEFMTMQNQGIPTSMIQKAQGLVIVPGMIKVGFVVGGRRGKGIAVVRNEQGVWQPPSFVTMTGGSVGFQAGVQSTDVVLVFNTRKSVNNLLSGKFTIGVDAAAAAGPVGRQAAAATDGRLQAEIYSYSRSRGLFAGASVDGSVIQMDAAETQNFYRAAGVSPNGTPLVANAQLPLPAAQFLAALGTYSGAPVSAPAAATTSVAPPTAPAMPVAGNSAAGVPIAGTNPPATSSVLPPGSAAGAPAASATSLAPPANAATPPPAAAIDATRQELAKSAQSLGALLDETWRQYLALPQGVFTGTATPTSASLRQSLDRFDAIAKESKYNLLIQRPEFQKTYGLLRTYLKQVEEVTSTPAPSASNPASATIR